MLGALYEYGRGGVAEDFAQAVAFYRLAAAQNLDGTQCNLGRMYDNGHGVAEASAEALQLYQLAAAQGHPEALFIVAAYHEDAFRKNKAEAIRWYRRAQAAGDPGAPYALQRLCA